jgi:hypothetical protein
MHQIQNKIISCLLALTIIPSYNYIHQIKKTASVLLFLLITSLGFSQELPDTILTKTEELIICKITLVNDDNVFYNTKKKKGSYVNLSEVIYHSSNKDFFKLKQQESLVSFSDTNFNAQELALNKEDNGNGYYEFNFGAAFIGDNSSNIPFPGCSFLFGYKFLINNEFIIDAEIGVALPSLATAKIGVGYKFSEHLELTIGVRPWPMHFYAQTQLSNKVKGGWIMSVEISPYYFNERYADQSFYSRGLINFGYRWNLN